MSEEVPDRVWWTMLRFIFISFGEQQKIIDERQWKQKFLITLAIMLEKKKADVNAAETIGIPGN